MKKQPKTIVGHIFSYLWNNWFKPPVNKRTPKTFLDIQRDASKLGGQQFRQISGLEQVFFWMPENTKGPKVGEYVYMRYEPDASGNIQRIISHIHYPVSKNIDGSIEVKKYFASTDMGNTPNYVHQRVDDDELKDLLIASKQFTSKLAQTWGYSS